MQADLEVYGALVASAALRHDFGVPLNLIGRHAKFFDDVIAEGSSSPLDAKLEARFQRLCRDAASDSGLIEEMMRSFGNSIKSVAKERSSSIATQRIARQFAMLNSEISSIIMRLADNCKVAQKICTEIYPYDKDFQKRAIRMRRGASRAQEMFFGLAHFFRLRDIDEANFESVSLAPIIEIIIQSIEEIRADKRLVIHIQGSAKASIVPSQFLLVMQNLVSNAAKFAASADRPEVRIEMKSIRFSELQARYREVLLKYGARGDWVEISVADNGPGVDLKIAKKIFDLYYTINPVHGDSLGGTGMGLAIAKLVATIHGGVLFVSQAKNPTIFSLVIPENFKDGISLAALTKLELAL